MGGRKYWADGGGVADATQPLHLALALSMGW